MTQICTGSTSKNAPMYDGPIRWQMPDGMDAVRAQKIMMAFVDYTHSIYALCGELNVPTGTARLYLTNSDTIPKGVYWKLDGLLREMKKNPARMLEIMQDVHKTGRSRYLPPEERLDEYGAPLSKTITDLNADARGRTGKALQEARNARGLTIKEAAERMTAAGINVSEKYLWDLENRGMTPSCRRFFPVCEFYNLDPGKFMFTGIFGQHIKNWRKAKNVEGSIQ